MAHPKTAANRGGRRPALRRRWCGWPSTPERRGDRPRRRDRRSFPIRDQAGIAEETSCAVAVELQEGRRMAVLAHVRLERHERRDRPHHTQPVSGQEARGGHAGGNRSASCRLTRHQVVHSFEPSGGNDLHVPSMLEERELCAGHANQTTRRDARIGPG